MVNFFTTFYHFPTKYSPEQNSRRRSFVSYTESRIFCLSATLFLEFWKRHRASFVCEWKVSDWCEEEVKPLLNYFNPTLQHRIGVYCRIHIMWFISFLNLCDRRNSSWRLWIMKTVNPENISTPICAARWFWSASQSWWVVVSDVLTKSLNTSWEQRGETRCVLSQILVIIGLTHALVVFRVIAAVLLAEGSWEFLSNHSNSGAMMLGAVLHYLIITVMTRVRHSPSVHVHRPRERVSLTPTLSFSFQVNRIVAMKLCEIGLFTCFYFMFESSGI